MAIQYPSTLPAPLAQNFGYKPNTTIVSDDDSMAPLSRVNRSNDRPIKYACSWMLTTAQKNIFLLWFRDDLAGGSKAFDLALPFEGLDSFTMRCYFTKPPVFAAANGAWRISGEVIASGD